MLSQAAGVLSGGAAQSLTSQDVGCSVMALGDAWSREMHQRVACEVVTGSPCGASSCLRCLAAVAGAANSSSEAAASTNRPVAALRALMLGSVVTAQVVSAGRGQMVVQMLDDGLCSRGCFDELE